MHKLLVFAGVLAFIAGFMQVVFPDLFDLIEERLNSILDWGEQFKLKFRFVSGVILLFCSLLLFFLRGSL